MIEGIRKVLFVDWPAHPIRRLCLDLRVMLILVLCSSCNQSPITYSIEEQYDIAFARAVNMSNQLEFSFHLEHDRVPFDQEIFFVATFTNTMDRPLVFREPRQYGVLEADYPDTTLLFTVKPITEGVSLSYPLYVHPIKALHKVEPDEFVTLPPGGSREIRLRLPHIAGSLLDQFPLPIGQYLVHMTYMNYDIGNRVELNSHWRYADLNAWVGGVEANPVALTITPEE
jgi:hypothetical protein